MTNRIVSATTLGLLLAVAALAAQPKANVSVTASVKPGSGSIQAVLQPGEFAVPAGLKAVNLRVQKHTILSGNASSSTTRSDKDIYCVSSAKYIPASQTELPSGNYKFAVGGGPGSTGTLVYDLVPAK